jgi:cell wall-associated NlpC family hydrolase
VAVAAIILLFAVSLPVSAEGILHSGDKGMQVAALQKRLLSLGYAVRGKAGIFDARTKEAVQEFQLDNGLEPDGIVGTDTWAVLRKSKGARVSRSRKISMLAARIILTAKKFMGVPYVWGGTSPRGFDCSGFVQYIFAENGVSLPRTADVQYAIGQPVTYSALRPGDIVYFTTYTAGPSHDGIYIGGGKFIDATTSRGVAIDRLDNVYWKPRYYGANRILH